ncbi:cupin domain-containing protein [Pseudoduganella sp. GCM10020061]|uniref:cupin domain-containing protein n=1 Tax=Pseudoduganella sp. GCM10020061 TaxID=3317345 RepID=UPI00362537CC
MHKHLSMPCVLLSACMLYFASGPVAAEPALAIASADSTLKWGACPDFMPKGCQLAVLHGDPAKANADVFLRVPGKSSVPMHIHTSAERMILTQGELHLTYEGQKVSVLKPGSYAYGPAKMPHKAVCASAKPCVLFIAFEQPVDAILVETTPK